MKSRIAPATVALAVALAFAGIAVAKGFYLSRGYAGYADVVVKR